MASISASPPILLRTNPNTLPSSSFPSFIVFSSSYKSLLHTRFRSLKSGSEGERAEGVDALSPDLLRKQVISHVDVSGGEESVKAVVSGSSSKNAHVNERFLTEEKNEENEEWVDWEDQILEDTVPLVGFFRTLLHSGNCVPVSTTFAKAQATQVHETNASQVRSGNGIRAGGVTGIVFVFVFVFAVLLGLGVYFVAITRKANVSKANAIGPDEPDIV